VSFDKAIQHGKVRRKPYRGSKAVDRTCRNHGSCSWCQQNRTYQARKWELLSDVDSEVMAWQNQRNGVDHQK